MNAGADATAFRLGPLRVAVSCDGNGNPTVSANTTAENAVIHAIALSTGGGQGDNRSADADFGRGETFVTGFGLSHSGTIMYIDQQVSVSATLLTQSVGGDCLIGGSAQGGPNLDR